MFVYVNAFWTERRACVTYVFLKSFFPVKHKTGIEVDNQYN